jgi:hypothetical protein
MSAQLVPVPPVLVKQPTPLLGPAEAAALAAAGTAQQVSGVSGASMLHRLLEDLQLLGKASAGAAAAGSSNSGGCSDLTSAEQQAQNVPTQLLAATAAPCELVNMLEGASALLAGLAENMEQQQLLELPMMAALQVSKRAAALQRTVSCA